jgi:hypothetical protein
LKEGPLGPLTRWNEKHKVLIMVTFFIVASYAIYLAIVIHHTPTNEANPSKNGILVRPWKLGSGLL